MHVLVLLRLIPIKVQDHLIPLLKSAALTRLTLIRREPAHLPDPKVTQYNVVGNIAENVAEYSSVQQMVKVIHLFWLALRTAWRDQPRVIYGIYLIPYGVYAWVIARLTGKKCMVSLIGTDLNKDVLELPLRKFWQGILKRMDVVTVFDESARQKLLALGFDPQKIFVLPHAIEMQRYQRDDLVGQDISVIYSGHFWALKEVHRVIEAWEQVIAVCPQATLVLLGEGDTRAELEMLVKKLNLTDSVTFAGWVKDVPSWLSRARMFINLSSEEGVPMSMLEAMACGAIPIVTDVGGVASVVKDGENGYLIPYPTDINVVAERIIRILNDDTLAQHLQQNALAVRQQYSYEAVAAWWQPIFERLNA